MSGYTDNAIVHHGVLDPGIRFIGKPFAAADLTRMVREVLDEDLTDWLISVSAAFAGTRRCDPCQTISSPISPSIPRGNAALIPGRICSQNFATRAVLSALSR